ncbi:hypothetical protein NCCP2222_32760 [Sporosarcina sp. NCCP-2222]|uniref:hypothetical protein n=1 Tax=Sporosarcina sp. NCCP-2222 TaxID=2935073 RepID=UPI002087D591|nr:hypothetical protein [Sporosarcina sp. NCCP-2222]GKV57329.1 hypothetical protein NCCP2222_32760 [Sporosarcina sp. NCCP-2222]
MILYFLEPKVSGFHGIETIYGTDEDIAEMGISGKIKFLHYEVEGWLGDDILESTPAFIVSSELVSELKKSKLKDFKLEKCLITGSDVFIELYPTNDLPSFTRFIPLGTVELEGEYFNNWSGHDFASPRVTKMIVNVRVFGKIFVKA